MNKFFLIGMPGSGKSTMAKYISSISDLNYKDLDDEIDLAYIIINSNGSDPISIIPINIELDNNTIIGDINGDTIVNVLDVVLLVNLVLNDREYDENSDLNLDGILNVLDIVLLVNIILNS